MTYESLARRRPGSFLHARRGSTGGRGASVAYRLMSGTAQTLLTAGLVLLLFAAYQLWGKSAAVHAHQADLDRQLAEQWRPGASPTPSGKATPPASLPGSAIARLTIPRLDKHWVVVEGVRPFDIRYAPGHYPGTAMPGEVGNFAVAGHRIPAIFWDLDTLRPNDEIIVQTRQGSFTYEVTEVKIVAPSAVEVVAPAPGRPGDAATERMLTLTTCNPKWDNYQRLVVHARIKP